MSRSTVLVAYAGKNGGTAGIADVIASVLRAEGLVVAVRPAGAVDDVAGYDAVVLGSALYAGHWRPDARRFVRRHAVTLTGRAVWLFSSGPLDASADDGALRPVPHAADAIRRTGACGHVTFGGRLDESADGFIARSMVRNGRGGDFRNAGRIAAWSRGVAAEIKARAAHRPHEALDA
jgi:menaquinone-dependent protoporphyrinogen oxidase